METREQAPEYMRLGYNCAQSVILAFAERLGVAPDVVLRMSSGFGGGMGRTGHTCGAVSGALMVIGLRYGPVSPEDKASKEKTYALVADFHRKFTEIYGATDCTALLGHNLGDPLERQKAQEEGLFKSRCPLFVESAAVIAEELLASQ